MHFAPSFFTFQAYADFDDSKQFETSSYEAGITNLLRLIPTIGLIFEKLQQMKKVLYILQLIKFNYINKNQ